MTPRRFPSQDRSADFQSAVSPNCIRQGHRQHRGSRIAETSQIENLRFSRLKICATIAGIAAVLLGIASAHAQSNSIITIAADQRGAKVSPELYGIFFEE